MKLLKNSITALLFGLFVVGLAGNLQAQDKRAAIKVYNKALELVQAGDYEQAINMYNQAIEEAKKLGPEGQDIITRSEDKIPEVYYQIALQEYKAFQKEQSLAALDATIESFQNTKEVAEEYSDTEISGRTKNIITQLLYAKSVLQYKQQNFAESLKTLNAIIEQNPNFAKAYYQKGIVIKNMDSKNLEETISQFDMAIEVAKKTNDSQLASRAQEAAHDELLYRGAKAIEAKNFDSALNLLQRALKYEPSSADAYYRLAEAFNKKQNWQEAVANANQALEYERGGKTEQAKIYFELGTAYQGLGQKENACSAYSNAAYGSFKSPAEHQMEYELKCESTTD